MIPLGTFGSCEFDNDLIVLGLGIKASIDIIWFCDVK